MYGVKVGCFGLLCSRQLLSQACYFRGAVCAQGLFYSVISRRTSTVIIRIPRLMQERIDNVKQVKRKNLDKVATVKAGKLLIKSKNPLLNQSTSYTLGKFEEPVLASNGWKSNKSFGDYFTINSTRSAPPSVPEPEDQLDEPSPRKTFSHLHLSSELVETLQRHNINHPTIVQMQTIPKLLRGHNVLCAAETGSGKTLAYLLPIIHRLHKEMPLMELGSELKTQALVLVPSRELAEQVTSVARTMSQPFGLKVKIVGGGRGVGSIKAAFNYGHPHILVATPGALLKALWKCFVDLSELRFIVVDEADTMFDTSFADMLEKILRHTQVASNLSEITGPTRKAQLVVVGATFPGGVGEVLGKVTDLGSLVTVKSRMLHYLMPHVKHTFVKVRGSEKILELHQAIKEAAPDHKAVLVFCNSAATVNWLGYTLDEMGLCHARLQGEMPAPMREGIFQNFQKGHVDVLLCTDIASRGLDTQRVGLVVNYDFPESHTDYIHRAGRVGRAGSSGGGRVLSFVTHPWDVELVNSIETAARRRLCLPGMEKEIKKPSKTISQEY